MPAEASFAAEIMGSLPGLRALAESLLTDTFRALKPGGVTTDPDGFRIRDYVPMGDVYGKVQGGGSRNGADAGHRTISIGDVDQVVMEGGLHISVDAPLPDAGPFGVGWEYECIAVGPESDPVLIGKRFLVVSAPSKSFATARRLDVAEVPG